MNKPFWCWDHCRCGNEGNMDVGTSTYTDLPTRFGPKVESKI